MKRLFDLVVALLLAPFALAVCAVVAIPIWIEAKASPLFLQTRLGRHEKPFKLLKMRTMHVSTPSVGSHQVAADAFLRSGRLLRRFKLDELPQIWNVINGTMSLVGPRPGLPVQEELTAARRAQGIFDLRPGITGPAQIGGVDMSRPQELALADQQYVGKWSLDRDLAILWATATGAGNGDAAGGGITK